MGRYFKVVVENRKARFDYHISDTYEAGLALTGTEVKSIRQGKANLKESFARVEKGEVWLHGMHISPYKEGNQYNPDPLRTRKLLLKKAEVGRLTGKVNAEGFTLVPLKLFFSGNWAKVTLGLAKAKRPHDKRAKMKEQTAKREMAAALSIRHKGK